MISIHPIVFLVSLLIWVVLGLAVGCITGIVMKRLLRRNKSKITVDLILGVLGSLTGVFFSGWAAQRTFNSGALRACFIWDENGQAIDYRTALAENQALIAVVGAVIFVMSWHFAKVVYRDYSDRKIR